jgi:hypothetical protein
LIVSNLLIIWSLKNHSSILAFVFLIACHGAYQESFQVVCGSNKFLTFDITSALNRFDISSFDAILESTACMASSGHIHAIQCTTLSGSKIRGLNRLSIASSVISNPAVISLNLAITCL